jgi:hypothetical protein
MIPFAAEIRCRMANAARRWEVTGIDAARREMEVKGGIGFLNTRVSQFRNQVDCGRGLRNRWRAPWRAAFGPEIPPIAEKRKLTTRAPDFCPIFGPKVQLDQLRLA